LFVDGKGVGEYVPGMGGGANETECMDGSFVDGRGVGEYAPGIAGGITKSRAEAAGLDRMDWIILSCISCIPSICWCHGSPFSKSDGEGVVGADDGAINFFRAGDVGDDAGPFGKS
jgi:hypothetical protein